MLTTHISADDLTAMPGLSGALDLSAMSARLGWLVQSAMIVRHKPMKRVLIHYETVDGPMLGKIRAGHRATTPFELLGAFRSAGFDAAAADGITVPEPVAVMAELGLWLQRVVDGTPMNEQLVDAHSSRSGRVQLGVRAAEAAMKVHASGVSPRRRHSVDAELRIVRERLGALAVRSPQLGGRIDTALVDLADVAATLAGRPECGIHRDFYPDQLLVDGDHITMVDFDLYCLGDPAVDIGNFAAHLIELAARHYGNSHALDDVVEATVATFLDRRPSDAAAVDGYITLTLARLAGLSIELHGRGHMAEPMLELVERRLRLRRRRPAGLTLAGGIRRG